MNRLCLPILLVAAAIAGACKEDPDGGPGVDGGGDVVQPPIGCDPSMDVKDAPQCVVSDFGVFVDGSSGSDGNAGTKESPVKSIGAALGKLGGKTRIYVCKGTYAEHVKVTSAVSLFGGFACGTWSYTGEKAKVAPTDGGYALEIEKEHESLSLPRTWSSSRETQRIPANRASRCE